MKCFFEWHWILGAIRALSHREFLYMLGLQDINLIFWVQSLRILISHLFFQIGACGYIEKLVQNSCWLIQAFSLACTVKGYKMREYEKQIWERRDTEGRAEVEF